MASSTASADMHEGKPWPPAGTTPLPIDVVSVQSRVVYGRVGNNVAVPTLEAFGLSVAAVPTVVLGNTPHYATMHGGAVPIEWFAGWLDDLAARGGLHALRATLSGFLGEAAQARALAGWLKERLAATPQLRIVVDPVIGDFDHGVYVDPALVDAYRQELLSLADVLTPNAFELARLTGRPSGDMQDTIDAARGLLRGRTRWVVVTSAVPGAWADGTMQSLLVARERVFVVTHPRIDSEPKGTGDLFAASLTGGWLTGAALPDAAVCACASVIAALRRTRDAHCAELLLPGPVASMEPRGEVSLASA